MSTLSYLVRKEHTYPLDVRRQQDMVPAVDSPSFARILEENSFSREEMSSMSSSSQPSVDEYSREIVRKSSADVFQHPHSPVTQFDEDKHHFPHANTNT
jgi:hypothetical protein